MSDADLLVCPGDALQALEVLRSAGWRMVGEHAPDVSGRNEKAFRAPGHDSVVDLHWRMEPWVTGTPDRDDALWAEASPVDVGGRSMLAPAPHDLALHIILHAFRSEWERVVRWIPDLVLLLRTAGDSLDWDAFTRRAVTGRVTPQVREAFEYVQTSFAAPIPQSVMNELCSVRTTRRQAHKERIASRRTFGRHWLYGEWTELRTSWARISVNQTRRQARRTFPAFLRARTRVSHLSTLPFVVVARRISRESACNDEEGPPPTSAGGGERVDGASERL